MAEEYVTKQVEVAGQIICELIRKDILPTEVRRAEGMPAANLAELLGGMYQVIYKAISTPPTSK